MKFEIALTSDLADLLPKNKKKLLSKVSSSVDHFNEVTNLTRNEAQKRLKAIKHKAMYLSVDNNSLLNVQGRNNVIAINDGGQYVYCVAMHMDGSKITNIKNKGNTCLYATVEFVTGKRRTYRLAPKLSKAIEHDKAMQGVNEKDYLLNSYIVVPAMPYYHKKTLQRVGKVISIKRSKFSYDAYCTRSQFVTPEHVKNNLKDCMNFLDHDYGFWSKLAIEGDLIKFKKQLS